MAVSKRKSLDILIAVGVVAALAGGVAWFFLGADNIDDAADLQPTQASRANQGSSIDVEATRGESPQKLLEKARLALSADMVAEPRGQNALYFYSLASEADPNSQEIQNEFAQVVDAVSEQLRAQIASNDFESANSLAERLALADPAASVLGEYSQAATSASEALIQQALSSARNGNSVAAQANLAKAEELFGVNAQSAIASARQEMASIGAERAEAAERRRLAALAAQQEKAAEARAQQVAAAKATDTAPVAEEASVAEAVAASDPSDQAIEELRELLAAGDLDGDGGAINLLAQAEQTYPDNTQLREIRGATIAAIQVRAQRELALEQLDAVQASIDALENIDGTAEISEGLVASLKDARIRIEGATVMSAKELVLVEAVPPVYPRSALRKDKEGWVEVEFTVKKDGRTENIQVINANQGTVFNKATIQAVSQWQFEPRNFAGELIDQRVATRVSFRLTGG
ncbi:MAG: TonB family protein [Pseudomonadota bacterium]